MQKYINAVTPFLIAGEEAGAWAKFGFLGMLLTNLAELMELSVVRNVGTAPHFEKKRRAVWPHSARGCGNADPVSEELVELNREELPQCIRDEQSESCGRVEGQVFQNKQAYQKYKLYRSNESGPSDRKREETGRLPPWAFALAKSVGEH